MASFVGSGILAMAVACGFGVAFVIESAALRLILKAMNRSAQLRRGP